MINIFIINISKYEFCINNSMQHIVEANNVFVVAAIIFWGSQNIIVVKLSKQKLSAVTFNCAQDRLGVLSVNVNMIDDYLICLHLFPETLLCLSEGFKLYNSVSANKL